MVNKNEETTWLLTNEEMSKARITHALKDDSQDNDYQQNTLLPLARNFCRPMHKLHIDSVVNQKCMYNTWPTEHQLGTQCSMLARLGSSRNGTGAAACHTAQQYNGIWHNHWSRKGPKSTCLSATPINVHLLCTTLKLKAPT